MDKILGTFYKGNSNRFGLGAWNTTVKDELNEVSKSQNIRPYSLNNPINEPSSVYNPEYNSNSRYNHFSPNLIRMQYFNDTVKEIEHKRNLYLQDYIKNSKYNVYFGQNDPLMDRKKDVQIRLAKIKNKLLNDEEKKLIRRQKKIEEENKIIDELIYENEKIENDDLFRIIDSKENNLNNKNSEINEEESNTNSEYLSNDYTDKNSILVLSRTSTNENESNEDFNLLMDENENESMIVTNKSFYSTKRNKSSKRKSVQRNSISQNKKPHTDILRVLMNVEKYSRPINNINSELQDQHRQMGDIFTEFNQDLKDYRKEFNEKIAKLNERTENNINTFKEILMMCENKNIKNSAENIFLRNGKTKLKLDKNYLDSEAILFKNEIDNNLNNVFDDYMKQRLVQDFEKKIEKEPLFMENDYNYRIKENKRSKYGLINITNLYNKIDKLDDIEIKPTNLEVKSLNFSDSNTIKSNIFTFSNNSKNNIFPALKGLREKYTTGINSINSEKSEKSEKIIENIIKEENNKKIKSSKKKNKKKTKNVYVKDLGIVPEDYEGHKDNKKGRKETILQFRNDNGLKNSNKTLINSNSLDKNKENNQ